MLAAFIFTVAAAQLAQLTSAPDPSNELALAMVRYSDEFVLTVSPSGHVIRCATLVSGGWAAVDKALCSLLLTTTATAAMTGDGVRAYGEIYVNVHGEGAATIAVPPDVELSLERLPAGSPAHPETSVALTIDPAGHVLACDVKSSSGVVSLDNAACKSGPIAAPPAPVNDEKGVPALSVKMFKVGFGV